MSRESSLSKQKTNCIHGEVCAYMGMAYSSCEICPFYKNADQLYTLPAPIGTDAYLVRRMRYDVDGYGMQFEYYWGIEKIKFSIRYLELVGKTVFFDEKKAEEVRKEKEKTEKPY